MLVVTGTSPFHDTGVAVGPFKSERTAREAASALECKGWNTEIIQLGQVAEVPDVVNDES